MILAAKNLFYPSQRVHIMSVDNYAILNISNTSIHNCSDNKFNNNSMARQIFVILVAMISDPYMQIAPPFSILTMDRSDRTHPVLAST